MSYIFGFAGSNSSTSINYKLVRYTASLISGNELKLLDMANCPFPMYSEDYEKENGYSNSLIEVKNTIQNAKGIILSVNEHNGNPSAYFKNLIDWLSRVDKNFIDGKKLFLMSTSGGKRGAKGAFEVTEKLLARFGAELVASFSLPGFHDNFDMEKGILDKDLSKPHKEALENFMEAIG